MTVEAMSYPRIGIREATRRFGVTPRALRFYEQKGLISATRNSLNHRFYDADARQKLELITALRSANVGLEDIREVLEADGRGAGRERALAKVRQRATAVRGELLRIERVLEWLGGVADARAL
jgi:DNA-binding transcriptional MerR regulator